MQNSWFRISFLLFLAATSCHQKQKPTDIRPSDQAAVRDSDLLVPASVRDTSLSARADTLKPLPATPPMGKTQNAPQNKKGTGGKGKEVHAPMPEKRGAKDAERLEKERQKRKKEGKE